MCLYLIKVGRSTFQSQDNTKRNNNLYLEKFHAEGKESLCNFQLRYESDILPATKHVE
jgi:hypothetical protein